MNTPTPTSANEKYAHSGEGKPSDAVVAAWRQTKISREGCAWDALGESQKKYWRGQYAAYELECEHRARELERSEARERKREQSEPLFTASMYGTAEAAEKARAAWHEQSVPKARVVHACAVHACDTCEGTGLANVADYDGALVIDDCPECGGESAPPSEQAGISDEVAQRALKVFWAAYDPPNAKGGMRFGRTHAGIGAVLKWYESAFPRGVGSGDGMEALKRQRARLDEVLAHPAPEAQAEKPVGHLNVSRFRGSDAMVNTDFDYLGDLPDGNYPVYLRPQPSASETPSADARDALNAIALEMRTRLVNNGKHTSQTLEAWADRIDAAIAAQRKEGES